MSKPAFIQMCHVFFFKFVERNSLNDTFAAPSTTLEWKTSKSGKIIRSVLFVKALSFWIEVH